MRPGNPMGRRSYFVYFQAPLGSMGAFWPLKSAPQSGEHRYNLLLTAHDAGQEEHVILGLGGEGAADGVVAADVEKLGALEEDVGEHEDNDIVAVI